MFYDPKNTKFKKLLCGIAGYFGKNRHAPNKSCISECLNLMHNRGPDARGTNIEEF